MNEDYKNAWFCIKLFYPHPSPPPLRTLARPAGEGANWRLQFFQFHHAAKIPL